MALLRSVGSALSMADPTAGTRLADRLNTGSTSKEVIRVSRIKKACVDVESIFVGSLIKAMRNSVPDDGFLEEAPGSDIYESIADQQFAEFLSQKAGLGLGRTLFWQMLKKEKLEDVAASNPAVVGQAYARTAVGRGRPRPDGLKPIEEVNGK